MSRKFLSVSLFSCVLLAGCAVGPDYKEPTAKLPAQWTPQDAGQSETIDIARWWERFEDPVLTSLIERAFEGNLGLAMARSRIEQARAQLGITRSGLFPAADVGADYTMSGKGSSSSEQYSLGASASWEIDVFGGVRRDSEASLADYRQSFADKAAAQIALAAEVAQDYFLYRCLQQELKITRDNLQIQKKTLEIAQLKNESEFVSGLDVVRSLADVQGTQAEIPELERQLAQSRNALEYLLGVPTGSLADELSDEGVKLELEKFVPETGVPASLVARRPDIIVASYKIHAATARIGAATADYLPRFFIAGDIYYRAPNVSELFNSSSRNWSVGPSVSWNIFSAGKTYYNVQLQKAIAEEAGLNWNDTVLSAIREVQDSLVSIGNERQRIFIFDELVKSTRKAYELSNLLYVEGEKELLDLLDAQRSLLTSEQKQVLSRKQFAVYIVQLYKALGGGWSEAALFENKKPENAPVPGELSFEQSAQKTS